MNIKDFSRITRQELTTWAWYASCNPEDCEAFYKSIMTDIKVKYNKQVLNIKYFYPSCISFTKMNHELYHVIFRNNEKLHDCCFIFNHGWYYNNKLTTHPVLIIILNDLKRATEILEIRELYVQLKLILMPDLLYHCISLFKCLLKN